MKTANVTSTTFNFAGVREAKKERTEQIESARRDQERENQKAKELAEAQIRNSKIAKGNEFNFSACIKGLRNDIKHTKSLVRDQVRDLTKEARENYDDTTYSIQRDYDLQIIFFDDSGRNEAHSSYEDIVLSELTKQDLIEIKEELVESAIKNPTDFKGVFGFCFDGRIDISEKDKKGYSDYLIGEYIDGGNIWDSEKGWHHK